MECQTIHVLDGMHIDAPGLQMFLRIDQSSRDSARLAYGCLIAGDGEFRLTHPILRL